MNSVASLHVLCQDFRVDFRVVLKNSENCIVSWDVWVVLKIELSSHEFTEHNDQNKSELYNTV